MVSVSMSMLSSRCLIYPMLQSIVVTPDCRGRCLRKWTHRLRPRRVRRRGDGHHTLIQKELDERHKDRLVRKMSRRTQIYGNLFRQEFDSRSPPPPPRSEGASIHYLLCAHYLSWLISGRDQVDEKPLGFLERAAHHRQETRPIHGPVPSRGHEQRSRRRRVLESRSEDEKKGELTSDAIQTLNLIPVPKIMGV